MGSLITKDNKVEINNEAIKEPLLFADPVAGCTDPMAEVVRKRLIDAGFIYG